MPAAEILERIAARWPLEALAPTREGEVASRYRYRDGGGEIGLIHSVSAPFCASCNRARLSADGKLFTCLFARSGHDLRALLRGGASDLELAERTRAIWGARADRYSAERAIGELTRTRRTAAPAAATPSEAGTARAAEQPLKVEMSYIGG